MRSEEQKEMKRPAEALKNGAPTMCGFLTHIFSRRQRTLPSSPLLPLTFLNSAKQALDKKAASEGGVCAAS